MSGVNIHVVECPYCSFEFYTALPKEDITEEIECVECEDPFNVQYEFEEREEQIEVDITLSTIEESEDE